MDRNEGNPVSSIHATALAKLFQDMAQESLMAHFRLEDSTPMFHLAVQIDTDTDYEIHHHHHHRKHCLKDSKIMIEKKETIVTQDDFDLDFERIESGEVMDNSTLIPLKVEKKRESG
ncbi:hypothetical protein QVD17_24218 [Tagetes erecta]|uniref:Uncharacterized protein n=1 Tax=Tagetes erecta TaxID=13708 RepID=A0AAD8KEX6_TARER|nr:hypothetical protein QVD17_24218 [Tagetes erecta]